MSDLSGLRLTRSERIFVITLSYLFCAPLIYSNGKKLILYIVSLASDTQRQPREEEGLLGQEGRRR